MQLIVAGHAQAARWMPPVVHTGLASAVVVCVHLGKANIVLPNELAQLTLSHAPSEKQKILLYSLREINLGP